jgi:hypothetical protein
MGGSTRGPSCSFVDAGYLFAAGSKLIAGIKLLRGERVLDPGAALEKLESLVVELTGLPLLRVSVPSELDRELLKGGTALTKSALSPDQKRLVRTAFKKACQPATERE